jgi:hypothetical protein
MRQDHKIVACAERLVKKLHKGEWRTYNGEYLKPVRVEIERMKQHCRTPDKIDWGEHIYLMGDQPACCPKCGTRSEFIELGVGRQLHACLGCSYVFILEEEERG